jgi:hypothetical protein
LFSVFFVGSHTTATPAKGQTQEVGNVPDLPRILARPDLPTVALPRVDAAAAGRPWAQLSQAAEDWGRALKEKQLPIDAALAASKYDVMMNDAKNEVAADPDINNWRPNLAKKQQEIQQKVLEGVTDARVTGALQLHAARTFGAHINDMTERAKVVARDKQLGDLDRLGNSQALIAAREDNPTLRASAFRIYESALASAETPVMVGGQVDPATGRKTGGQLIPATIKPDEAEKLRQAFPVKVLTNRMEILAKSPEMSNQDKLDDEVRAGVYDSVPGGEVAKYLEMARSHQETLINKVESDKNKIKHQVLMGAQALANFGLWSDASAEKALKGEDPWIDPDKARTLLEINNNPPETSGAGNLAARTIASEYHLGPRTRPRIEATLRQLNKLQSSLGRPNKIIDQLGNELQTDIDHLDTLDVSKQNQTQKVVHDAIEAVRPALPFNSPIFTNPQKRDDAIARDKINKGMDPKQVIDEALKKGKTNATKVPDKVNKAREALGQ